MSNSDQVDCEHCLFDHVSRQRHYTYCYVTSVLDIHTRPEIMYDHMVKYFRTTRSRKLLPQDALCAPISEVLTEGFVLCQSRNIPAASFLNSGCDQRILLTANQRDYIATYSKQWISRYGIAPELCPCAFFNLTDNPERRLTWTSAHMKLPAFRTNSTLIWSPAAWGFGANRLIDVTISKPANSKACVSCSHVHGQVVDFQFPILGVPGLGACSWCCVTVRPQ